jgi:hypothetical protein
MNTFRVQTSQNGEIAHKNVKPGQSRFDLGKNILNSVRENEKKFYFLLNQHGNIL